MGAFARGLALSLPAPEIAAFRAPGSVFDLPLLDRGVLSAPLRDAIRSVERLVPAGAPIRVVVRPEMFTHADTARWIDAKLGAIADHLCISDGATIRVLPGLANHVFFHLEADEDAAAARLALLRRAPELFASLASQVNTTISGRPAGQRPPTLSAPCPLAPEPTDAQAPAPTLLPLYLNRHSAPDSYGRAVLLPPIDPDRFDASEAVEYCALTDRGLASPTLAAELARRILAAYTRPERLLLLWVPQHRAPAGAGGVEHDVMRFLRRLAGAPVLLPRLPVANVVLVAGDPTHAVARGLARPPALAIDSAFETWRFAALLGEATGAVTLLEDRDAASGLPRARAAVERALGRAVRVVPLRAGAPHPDAHVADARAARAA